MLSGIPQVLKWNGDYVVEYLNPDVVSERRLYLVKHPTAVLVFKCMDGRLKFTRITGKVPGTSKPMRNIGGCFNAGWPALEQYLSRWGDEVIGSGRHGLIISTYHYSQSEEHLGCRGFDYEVEKARGYISNMRAQFERVFGSTVFNCIMMGIETDLDCLILHGEDGSVLDLSECLNCSELEMTSLLARIYPRMKPEILADLVPLVMGNIEHVTNVISQGGMERQSPDHQEWIIGLGRGFEYMHSNSCLIVGPYDPNLDEPVVTAGSIVLSNLESGRVKDRQPLLLVSCPYSGHYQPYAVEKAHYLREFGARVLRERVPDLFEKWGLEVLYGVTNTDLGGEFQALG